MKRSIIILIIAAVCSMAATAQSPFFNKCENINGVSTVYITKAMLQMVGNMKMSGGMDFSGFFNKLDNVQIITSETATGIKALAAEIKTFDPANGYDQLMRINDDGDKTTVWFKHLNDKTNSFVLIADKGDELTVIILEGSMTVEEMTAAVKHKSPR